MLGSILMHHWPLGISIIATKFHEPNDQPSFPNLASACTYVCNLTLVDYSEPFKWGFWFHESSLWSFYFLSPHSPTIKKKHPTPTGPPSPYTFFVMSQDTETLDHLATRFYYTLKLPPTKSCWSKCLQIKSKVKIMFETRKQYRKTEERLKNTFPFVDKHRQ